MLTHQSTIVVESGLIHYYITRGSITQVNRSVTAQPLEDAPKKKGLMSGRPAVKTNQNKGKNNEY